MVLLFTLTSIFEPTLQVVSLSIQPKSVELPFKEEIIGFFLLLLLLISSLISINAVQFSSSVYFHSIVVLFILNSTSRPSLPSTPFIPLVPSLPSIPSLPFKSSNFIKLIHSLDVDNFHFK